MEGSPRRPDRRASIDSAHTENTEAQIEWENASTISGTSTVEDDVVGKLFSRVRHNRGKEAEKLLDSGCTTVDCRDASGCTPLMVACQNGHKRMVKMLLKRYANPNAQNHAGQTSLHFCFRFGHTELGEYIVSKGGNPDIPDVQGLTCRELLPSTPVAATANTSGELPQAWGDSTPAAGTMQNAAPDAGNASAQAILAEAERALQYAAGGSSSGASLPPQAAQHTVPVPSPMAQQPVPPQPAVQAWAESSEGSAPKQPVPNQMNQGLGASPQVSQQQHMGHWEMNPEQQPLYAQPHTSHPGHPGVLSVNTEDLNVPHTKRTPGSMSPGTGGLSTESPINSAPSVSPEDSPMSQGGSLNGSPDSFSSLGNNPACSRSRGASFMHSLDEMVLRAKEAQGMSRGSRRSAAPKQQVDPYSTIPARQPHPAALQQAQYNAGKGGQSHSPYGGMVNVPYQGHGGKGGTNATGAAMPGGFGGMTMSGPPPEPQMPRTTGNQEAQGLNMSAGGMLQQQRPPVGMLHNPPSPAHRQHKRKDKARASRAPLPSTVQGGPMQSMSVIVDNTSPPASLESNQMPSWNQLQQQQQPSNPDSGFVDVEAMRDALASVEHSGGSGTPGPAVSKFENEWTMPREPAAAHQVPAAMFNDEHGTCVQSPHAQQQQGQAPQDGWGGAAGRFIGNFF